MIQSSQKDSQISDFKKQIESLEELTSNQDTEMQQIVDGTDNVDDVSDGVNYLQMPKVGLKIPLAQDIIDRISLVELDSGYRIDVKMISNYREQGHCGSGGSGAIGIVSKENVDIVKNYIGGSDQYTKTKSEWSDATIAKFENNVIYPKEYVAFNNLDAVCYDLGDGGAERGQEVAKEVQEINDALEAAFLNAKSIK